MRKVSYMRNITAEAGVSAGSRHSESVLRIFVRHLDHAATVGASRLPGFIKLILQDDEGV